MSSRVRSIAPAALVACAGLLPPLSSYAADNDRAAGARDGIEEVTVTGEKLRSQTLNDKNGAGSRLGMTALDTPATVQVITGDSIRLRGDSDIGMSVTRSVGITSSTTSGGSGYGVTARGFGSASVTALYDGIKSLINIGSGSYPFDTWNIERIEVLNGPASVLFGNGAIGGAINIVPRKATQDAVRTIVLSSKSFGTQQAAIDVGGGVTDALAYRLDISRRVSDGYVDQGGSSGTAVTGSLAYDVNDTLRLTFSADYAHRLQFNYNGVPLINGQLDERLRHVNYQSADSEIPFTDQRFQVAADWQISDAVTLRNITYWIDGNRLWRYPSRFTYRPATDDVVRSQFGTFLQDQDQIGNHTEVQWQNKLGGLGNTVVVGADVNRLANDRLVDNYTSTDVVDLFNTNPGAFPGGAITQNYQTTDADEYSVFAEDRLEVTLRLSLVGGVRFDNIKVDRKDLVTGTSVGKTFSPVSSRVGAVYEIKPQLNFYAQYATATDAVSTLCCISAAQLAFGLSEGKQTEIGLKQVALDGRLEWTVGAYRIVKNRLLTPDPANLGQSLQIGQQSSRGIETGAAFQFEGGWRLEANAMTLDAVYDDFAENVSGVLVSRDGNEPVNVPQESANLWLTRAFGAHWYAQAAVRYVGGFFTNTANDAQIPSYSLVEFGVTWTPRPMLEVDMRVTNAGDKFYAYTSVNNGNQWVLGPPRAAELGIRMTF